MTLIVQAVYENGVLPPKERLMLERGKIARDRQRATLSADPATPPLPEWRGGVGWQTEGQRAVQLTSCRERDPRHTATPPAWLQSSASVRVVSFA